MNLLELLRNRMFWILDYKNGDKVRKYLRVLQEIEGNGGIPDSKVDKYLQTMLKNLLTHTQKTVPLFADYKTVDIKKWPVTNKMTYRNNYEMCISEKYKGMQLIEMSTSGSTGTPFVCYQNKDKKKHVNAETLFYNGEVGFKIGRRIIYLRSIVSEVRKSPMEQFAQNIYLLDCNDLSDGGIKKKLKTIERLSKKGGAMLMGYASTFEAFHQFFDKYGYSDVEKANIYGIVSGSEMLYDQTRLSMEKAFKCKCVSRYANEENGFLGQDRDQNNVFYMNRAHYYFEILKLEEDLPANIGEIGRIVVTDLFNYAMPMIRYDTGDIGTFIMKNERKVIASFGGRKVDVITNSKGEVVSPHSVTNLMWKYRGVRQYQLVQKDKGRYLIIINKSGEELDETTLIYDYMRILGKDANITVQYTDDIPVLGSGKRRYIINEMDNSRK